jgi:hypothetical protein
MTRSCKSNCKVAAKHPVIEALEEIAAQEVTVELVAPEEWSRWDKLIRKHHYLKEHRMVGESLRYVALQNGQWIALLGWSSAAFHVCPREAWIGWSAAQRNAGRHFIACNARFALLLPKGQSPNLASQILSLNLKRLSDDWQQYYEHPLLLAETYVDPERFEGTCYRAANWIEIGVTKGFGRSRIDFYQLHNKPKAIMLYPLHPKAREILSAPVMPSPWEAYRREAKTDEYPLNLKQTQTLLKALDQIKDPRRNRGWRHRRIASIVAIATAAMIAGNNSLLDIGDFSQSLNQNELRSLGAYRCRKTGSRLAPSESTIRRILQRLDPVELDRIITDWLRSHLKDLNVTGLAVDGKCVRTAAKINGQTLQLFGALDTQSQLFCRQIEIPAKTNEIPALKDLLHDLDLRGTLVTADAINTQKSTAILLVEEKKADYLLVVKENQPKLLKKLGQAIPGAFGRFSFSGHDAQPEPRPA